MPPKDRWKSHDVLAEDQTPTYAEIEVRHGMTLTHTGSNTTGTVAGFSQGDRVVLIDRFGTRQTFRAFDGAFLHEGTRVALRAPERRAAKPVGFTASGSRDIAPDRAQVAQPSRIWVEGIHDAELIEKIWGDDLRYIGVAVEPLHGADDLAERVARFSPGPDRRLGVLLDHLVAGSKEFRIAQRVSGRHVLVTGHPYVDVWAAVSPAAIGLERWPAVPAGMPWKEGVVASLGLRLRPAEFWRTVLDSVDSYRDLETPLVNAVERLIDFVATEG